MAYLHSGSTVGACSVGVATCIPTPPTLHFSITSSHGSHGQYDDTPCVWGITMAHPSPGLHMPRSHPVPGLAPFTFTALSVCSPWTLGLLSSTICLHNPACHCSALPSASSHPSLHLTLSPPSRHRWLASLLSPWSTGTMTGMQCPRPPLKAPQQLPQAATALRQAPRPRQLMATVPHRHSGLLPPGRQLPLPLLQAGLVPLPPL